MLRVRLGALGHLSQAEYALTPEGQARARERNHLRSLKALLRRRPTGDLQAAPFTGWRWPNSFTPLQAIVEKLAPFPDYSQLRPVEGLIRFGECVECESEERPLLSRNSEHRCMEDVARPIGGLEGVLSQRFLTAYELSQDMVYLEYLDLADLASYGICVAPAHLHLPDGFQLPAMTPAQTAHFNDAFVVFSLADLLLIQDLRSHVSWQAVDCLILILHTPSSSDHLLTNVGEDIFADKISQVVAGHLPDHTLHLVTCRRCPELRLQTKKTSQKRPPQHQHYTRNIGLIPTWLRPPGYEDTQLQLQPPGQKHTGVCSLESIPTFWDLPFLVLKRKLVWATLFPKWAFAVKGGLVGRLVEVTKWHEPEVD